MPATATRTARQLFTINWTAPSGVTVRRENETATRIEGIGRLLTDPAITNIEVLNAKGEDCTFDFEFALR